jgi:hypothetical protein
VVLGYYFAAKVPFLWRGEEVPYHKRLYSLKLVSGAKVLLLMVLGGGALSYKRLHSYRFVYGAMEPPALPFIVRLTFSP